MPLVNRRRGPLEHVEMLGISAQVRHQLNAGGARSDERDTLVGEFVSPPVASPPV